MTSKDDELCDATPSKTKIKVQAITPVNQSQQPSHVPASKKQRISAENGVESDIIDLLSDTSFLSSLDDLLVGASGSNPIVQGDSSQTTISHPNPTKRKKKKQKKKKKKKKIKKKQNTASARVFRIKEITVNIVRYLEIKKIFLIRAINRFFSNLLHFKFICDDFNVYLEYSNKLLIDEIVKHQICDKIENIALWYFASLNRTVGQPIFEREKEKEYDCKIQFDAFMKNSNNNHHKSFVCVMKCLAEEEIDDLDFVLSQLPQELAMNEINGECAVLPFSQLYQQLENIQREVKHIENCSKEEIHVFSDIVSFICFVIV